VPDGVPPEGPEAFIAAWIFILDLYSGSLTSCGGQLPETSGKMCMPMGNLPSYFCNRVSTAALATVQRVPVPLAAPIEPERSRTMWTLGHFAACAGLGAAASTAPRTTR
jgi:hypothetical protein